ncbi:ribonuclease HepT family protein [Sandaracinobacteroides saxicola]|uniref:DUF86 domain-containing protein n=1 Tax=Sandaracinobacteroides saxicola TaxID=2759707 RepID=A0A7G5IF66_9SPHN|nr:hypothetical protein [Sandaracinobacteroides saxicola]QMW22008.1 hypothetical protein H3309_11565 [Sandaracinobacteroides saxicola]
MTAPETAILQALDSSAATIAVGVQETLDLLGPPPASPAAFDALDRVQRTAATALLKRIEQQQDILARMFRTALIADGVDIAPMTARDIANRMEKLGVIPDAAGWSALVRLRNRLAHEYPLNPHQQHQRLLDAIAAAPLLDAIHSSLADFLRRQALLPVKG